MPQDFAFLSMTELRNRPGEILDRVAEGGASFIIERNGARKACLVPLSVFFPDISPARIGDEIQELENHGEKPRTSITEQRELAFRFPLKLADESPVELSIVLPHGYPHNCPRVYAESITGSVPHRWRDGALCVYGVMSGWNPGKHTVYSTLALAKRWLSHFESWRQTGQWPADQGVTDES